MSEDTIASDRLRGIKAIAAFIGESERRTIHLIDKGLLHVAHEGFNVVASKRRLRRDWERRVGVDAGDER
jgi:hypothetical protein